MFIWFVTRDSAGSPWQSGIYRTTGSREAGPAEVRAAARPLNPVNGKLSVKGGTKNPAVTVYLRPFCVNNPVGARVGLIVDARSSPVRRSPYSQPQLTLGERLHDRLSRHRPDGGEGQDVHGDRRRQHGERATR